MKRQSSGLDLCQLRQLACEVKEDRVADLGELFLEGELELAFTSI